MHNNKRYFGAWLILLAVVALNTLAIASVLGSGGKSTPPGTVASTQSVQPEEAPEIDELELELMHAKEVKNEQEKKPVGVTHVVKSGETLSDISSTYKISVDSLVDANNLDSPDKLKIGQQVFIPGATETREVKIVRPENTKSTNSPTMLASRSSSASLNGIWPVKGNLTSRFGMRGGVLHKGIDLAAPAGTNVYAYAGGKVVFSGWDNGGYGYLVIISHGNGIETYYAHNSKLLVSAGQSVSRGQHIAEVGNTGDSDGSHCHFEIRKNGTPVNPLNYLG